MHETAQHFEEFVLGVAPREVQAQVEAHLAESTGERSSWPTVKTRTRQALRRLSELLGVPNQPSPSAAQ